MSDLVERLRRRSEYMDCIADILLPPSLSKSLEAKAQLGKSARDNTEAADRIEAQDARISELKQQLREAALNQMHAEARAEAAEATEVSAVLKTFREFLSENSRYQPRAPMTYQHCHERMFEGFIAYTDEVLTPHALDEARRAAIRAMKREAGE